MTPQPQAKSVRPFVRRTRIPRHPRLRTFPVETGYELWQWRMERNWTLYRAAMWWGCSPKTWYEWEFRTRLSQPVMHRIAELTYMERQCDRLGIQVAMTPDAPHISGFRKPPPTPEQARRRAEWRRQQQQHRQDLRESGLPNHRQRMMRRAQRRAATLAARYGSAGTAFQRFVAGLRGRFPKLSNERNPLRYAAGLWWSLPEDARSEFRRVRL
jgi:hypothetical protein